MLSFISQLLDLSRIEAGELRITTDSEKLAQLVDDSPHGPRKFHKIGLLAS